MKIYFSGSILGGRDDAPIYAKIVNLLKNYGEILTEHVGDINLPKSGENKPREYIYKRDMEYIKFCDVFVADVSTPSVGVGYEIREAEFLNKKILCLYREGAPRPLSGMIEGNKNLIIKIYKTVDELPLIIDEFFK